MKRKETASAKRKSRERPARANRFKDKLSSQWITAALWCRSSHGILEILDASAMKGSDVKAIETDITRLGLTETRKPDHEPKIKESEAMFRELLDSVKPPLCP